MNAKNDTPRESESTEPAADKDAAASAASTPAEQPAEAPAVQSKAKQTDKTADTSASTPTEKTAEKSGDTQAQTAVDESGSETVSASDAESVETAGDVAAAPVQKVYVTAPQPPRPKGNRGIGTLLAVVATIVFAVVYAAAAAILILFVNPSGVADAVTAFLTNPLFFVPALAFLVMMILWALIANRASWWSWVIGSLIIAVVTYFASIGVLLLLAGGFGLTASQGTDLFVSFATNPVLIAAALIARESAIWFGAAIARRGRKVRERNYEAWQAFEREEAQKRAEFDGAAAH